MQDKECCPSLVLLQLPSFFLKPTTRDTVRTTAWHSPGHKPKKSAVHCQLEHSFPLTLICAAHLLPDLRTYQRIDNSICGFTP